MVTSEMAKAGAERSPEDSGWDPLSSGALSMFSLAAFACFGELDHGRLRLYSCEVAGYFDILSS